MHYLDEKIGAPTLIHELNPLNWFHHTPNQEQPETGNTSPDNIFIPPAPADWWDFTWDGFKKDWNNTFNTRYRDNRAEFERDLQPNIEGFNKYTHLVNLLNKVGIFGDLANWAAAQALFETAHLTSPAVQYNNLSNIAYTPHSIYQHGKGYRDWAAYTSPLKWALDFRRVLSLKNVHTSAGTGGAAAIKATSLDDFVDRLKNNGYFGAGNANIYKIGLKSIVDANRKFLEKVKQYQKATGTNLHLRQAPLQNLNQIPVLGWVVIGLVTILVVKKVIE
jgi:hypothetical protein